MEDIMALVHYTATVRPDRLLELPPEAHRLTQPGQQIAIELEDTPAPAAPKPNEGMLSFLKLIEERHRDRPYTDGSNTQRLIDEARGGAMYGYDPIE
jgi:hypothetical protein